ncbi:MAG: penicillin-binding transpeptidase domain-containing protein, partial [Pseudomonas sp.]|nr:penicillin-binding transpeptidase domain-containing protein [Pseudomonas sp.]
PESRLPGMTKENWLSELNKQTSLGGLEPAIVTSVEKSGIMVLLRNGEEHAIAWDSMKWARPFLHTNSIGPRPQQPADVSQIGDLIRVQRQADDSLRFVQLPAAQSALVSLDPNNGAIRALVGGFSFEQSNYNRAVQAKRQPGSSFKPFVYSAALDKGYTAATLVNDAPIVFAEDSQSQVWRPKNDNNTFLGPIRLREALYRSRNLVSIRLLQDLGINSTLSYIERFGFEKKDLPPNLSLALGTASLTPMEIAEGWSVFASGGYKTEPYLIERIEDRTGKPLFNANPMQTPTSVTLRAERDNAAQDDEQALPEPVLAEQIIDERTAYIMTSLLQDVIKRGTGRRAMALGRDDLAGKTGTTNESKDSWFSGYNADYITTVWAGFDQPESLGRNEYGGTVALPIWMSYMAAALKDKPSHVLPEPEGILTLRIDPHSGRAATPDTPNAYFELFKSEDSPPPMGEFEPGMYIPGSPLPADQVAPIDLF